MNGRIHVLVVDDDTRVREAICGLLQTETDIKVVSEAYNGMDAIEKARQHKPDLILMDVTMPAMNGLEATKIIHAESPSVQILMVSQQDSPAYVKEAFAVGASGYVIKTKAANDLLPEIRRLRNNHSGTDNH